MTGDEPDSGRARLGGNSCSEESTRARALGGLAVGAGESQTLRAWHISTVLKK